MNDGDLARRRLQLLVDAPLHEGVKTHAARLLGDEASDGGAARAAQWIGPAPPVAPVPLGQRGVGGELGQRVALAFPVAIEFGVALELIEDRLQQRRLQGEHGVAFDAAADVQRAPRVGGHLQRAPQRLGAGDLLDAQV